MTPLAQAIALYREQAPKRDFWSDLHQFVQGGYVFATPSMLLMAFPVTLERAKRGNLTLADADPSGDAWFIWLAVGNLPSLVDLHRIAGRKTWLAYARRGIVSIRRFDKLERINIS